eukprot:TRINITY_DN1283_c0_g1_i1.p1 TRINITY_DN1283_c0_g1~~TRINITY_DN1283_c0_g1_i1.p1  ORF type:complete len:1906 (+),score=536.96 TRINITY_DN1283_c0_g1_i1:52-5769(+)
MMQRLVLIVMLAAAGVMGHSPCLSSLLPFDLDLINIVERAENREVHLTGEYRLEDGAPGEVFNNETGFVEHRMTIKQVLEDGFLRVSVSHADGIELKMVFMEDDKTAKTIEASSVERMLHAQLTTGKGYDVIFMYRIITQQHCPSVNLELGYVYDKIINFIDITNEACLSAGIIDLDVIQDLNNREPGLLNNDNEFKTIADMETVRIYQEHTGYVKPQPDAKNMTFLKLGSEMHNFNKITLPHLTGMRSEYLLKVVLSADFILGGSIGMVVTPYSFQYGDCGDVDIEECISKTEGAFIATGKRGWWKNTMFLQTVLTSRKQVDDIDTSVPSEYKLWVYNRKEVQMKKDLCVPFHVTAILTPVREQEDPINCDATPLPAVLNMMPGYYDAMSSSLHVYQLVGIDRDTGVQRTKVLPDKDSLLRIYVEHPTVSVKITLKSEDTSEILTHTEVYDEQPRGIVYSLKAKTQYSIYFTESQNVYSPDIEINEWIPFCDKFLTRIELMPIVKLSPPETSVPEVPGEDLDFSKLQEPMGIVNFTTITGHKDVEYAFSKKLTSPYWTQQTIASWTFTLEFASAFRLSIARDFLQGDVVAVLETANPLQEEEPVAPLKKGTDEGEDFEAVRVYSTNDLRLTQLDEDLMPGDYTLKLMTAFVQATEEPGEMEGHPQQVEYSMDLLIAPIETAFICEDSRNLPDKLELQHHTTKHIFELFTIPSHKTHSIEFSPTETGLLHFQIIETKTGVSASMWKKVGDEWNELKVTQDKPEGGADSSGEAPTIEELYEGLPWMMFNFLSGQTYQLRLSFHEDAATCETFMMQLSTTAIVQQDDNAGLPCDEVLPSGDLLTPLTMPFEHDKIYTHRSDRTMPHTHINFTITKPAVFKALVKYNFKFQHIYLDVCMCSDALFTSCNDCGSIRGKAIFDGEEIRTQQLEKGHYVLKVYESVVAAAVKRQSCEKFHLYLWADDVTRSSKDALPGYNCSHQFLAKDLNVPGMLVDDEFHAVGDIRIDNDRRADTTTFTVSSKVVFRMWVPPSYDLPDIEIYMHLTKSPESEDWQDILVKEGKTLLVDLEEGTYQVYLYYKYTGAVIPNEDDGLFHRPKGMECLSTPVEISIMKQDDYHNEKLNEICKPFNEFPTTFPVHGHTPRRRPTDKLFNHHMEFTFGDKGGRVEFDLRSTFETGSMHMHLMKKEDEGEQDDWAHYYPIRYLDRDYLYVTLGEGNYMVMFLNTTDDTTAGNAQGPFSGCQKYSLHLSIEDFSIAETVAPMSPPNATVAPERKVDCELNKVFPNELQESYPTNMVLIEGKKYTFLQAGDELTDMPLMLGIDKLVRVWTHTHNVDIDVNLRVLDAEGGTVAEKVTKSTHVEAMLAFLPGNEVAYSVRVVVPQEDRLRLMEREEYKDCNEYDRLTTFDFAVGEMSMAEVSMATVCEEVQTIEKQTLDDKGLNFKKKYAITNEHVSETQMMPIEILPGMSDCYFKIEARFNFVLMALRLEFTKDDGSMMEPEIVSTADAELDPNDEEGFEGSSVLEVKGLDAGKYFLNMKLADGDVVAKHILDSTFCLKYTLSIQAAGSGTGKPVPFMSLSPEQMDDVLPLEPLTITMSFTEPVTFEKPEDALTMLCECQSKVCTAAGTKGFGLTLLRNSEPGQKEATFTFQEQGAKNPLRWDSLCTLKIKQEAFKTLAGDVFKPTYECGKEGNCAYRTVGGACHNGLCYAGGLCGAALPSKCSFVCESGSSEDNLRPVPDDNGICPYEGSKKTPMPTSEPVSIEPLKPTAEPTANPSPSPLTSAPPTEAPATSKPTTHTPTAVPPIPDIPETSAPSSPVPTLFEEKASNISAGLVLVIILVVLTAIVAVYTAWKKGYIATDKYRSPYGHVDAEFEDDDDNLFEDDDDEDEGRAGEGTAMQDVQSRPEV